MLNHLFSPEALLVILVVFGIAPGAALRVIVLAFPADDPRRQELRAELYAVPRYERPLWVAEQIEIAISEGLWGRLVWAATGRVIYRWRLRSGVEAHKNHPETFWIPSEQVKDKVEPGFVVKLAFDLRGGGERMWVSVTAVKGDRFVGNLRSMPAFIPRLYAGDEIKFKRDHIIDVLPPNDELQTEGEGTELRPVCHCCSQDRCESTTATEAES
jgi:Uncharacterized protein conserved in bacteria (DUF2314)